MSTPISKDGVDHALKARRAEQDRISESLLTLESNTTYQLLDGSALRGGTLVRWSAAQDAAATMWALNDAYRRTMRQAEDVRARRARVGSQELAELNELLNAPTIEIPSPGSGPLTLLPAPDERISLDEVVDRMEVAFRRVMEVVEAVDAVWSAAFPRLDEAAAAVKEAYDLAAELGESPGLGGAEDEVRAMREAALLDPLGTTLPAARLDQVLAALRTRLTALRAAVATMREYGRRKELLTSVIAKVAGAEQQARLAHTEVAVKILLPPTARPQDGAGRLSAELESIDASAEGWSARADRLTALERSAAEAETQALRRAGALRGLLGRREELRGRLLASQAKAVRKRLAEDPEASRLYDEARQLLWTAPCDLNRAAQLVERYSREVNR
ncbi:hypothetical protein [Nonomuraea soli]|uniref:Uncharacterized protein n=1 Tax=Nonomuraea soli TaxID=1032476 RepID=A0A7W0CDV0_9ACTN|nr:hypothetical protein [Nonomuraea soli]MBA2889214.1 hypothetical protein [Nonomuraea soli]